MAQFVPDELDIPIKIPAEVKKALAEERLVFFCGAGISCYMGLPLFDGLVDYVCEKSKTDVKNHIPLDTSYSNGRYDRVLGLLEMPSVSGVDWALPNHVMVRRAVIECLEEYHSHKEPETHKALLSLSALSSGGYRLVTTNFDRLFFKAGLELHDADCAPALSPPRYSYWRNASFLHGVIDRCRDPEGKNLVLTHADFGRTYLDDAWAARFIIRLFRDFTVIFVGYSLSDPVMDYLIATIGAEVKGKVYAFADHKDNNYQEKKQEWESRQIKPLLYNDADGHKKLHKTLRNWAKRHVNREDHIARRDRWLSKISSSYSLDDPDIKLASDLMEDLIIDPRIAEVFPNHPKLIPDISWLQALDKGKWPDLSDLMLKPSAQNPAIISKPARQIGWWLAKHLDKAELIDWVIGKGGVPHPEFRDIIREALANEWEGERLPSRMRIFFETVSSEEYARDHARIAE